jgi:lysophospholipase L1-like esterase
MIHVTGDSHAGMFKGIKGVKTWRAGQITLKRVGNPEDDIIPANIQKMKPTKNDIIVFCFGEIDMRCYVKPLLEHRRGLTLEKLLSNWVEQYTSRISSLNLNGAKIALVSVVPPSRKVGPSSFRWPIGGTLQERVEYVKTINKFLKEECKKKKWIYLDVYSLYADKEGILPLEETDESVHIINNDKIKKLIMQMGE